MSDADAPRGANSREEQLRALASRLGVAFHDLGLLDRALTHASIACEDTSAGENYESLEFLGDAALSLAVAHALFEHAPDRTPGEYSRMRAAVVNRRSLARTADELALSDAIRLGKGEEQAGGRNRQALLEDCLEAFVGALYLDQGWAAVRAFVDRVFADQFSRAKDLDTTWDFKSRLQHYCQARRLALPEFILVRSHGPDHRKEFEVEVWLRGAPSGRGVGASKKAAEQSAAKQALIRERQLPEDRSA